MRKKKKVFEKFRNLFSKNIVSGSYFVLILLLGIIAVPRIFAEQQAIKSIEIFSEKLNYMNEEAGSWKVTKSAKWISKGTAEITFDVDTIRKNSNKNVDVLFVLDVSGSMTGDRLERVKSDTIELIDNLLEDNKNKAGLITFDVNSQIVSDFTDDKAELIEKVKSLPPTKYTTNYYKALINVDTVLKRYTKESNRDCIILFLTDGYPNEDTPNEVGQFNYLKSQYPFIILNGIQYEMGRDVMEPIKKISDNQYVADMKTLNNVLFEASLVSLIYDDFEVTDYIDTNYFYVDDEKNIEVDRGDIKFDKENQKFTWKIDGLKSGLKASMKIRAKLKENFIEKEGFYPTNEKEEIKSTLDGDYSEDITSSKTPVLSNNYKVSYDGNAPNGCSVEGVPKTKVEWPFDTVAISDTALKCDGYEFRGFEIITEGVKKINDDYFEMPEKDVTLRAKWGKLDINKSTDGEVYVAEAYLEEIEHESDCVYEGGGMWTCGNYYYSELHKYSNTLKKIVFQDDFEPVNDSVDILDLSENKDGGILAYIVPDSEDSSKYVAYVKSINKRIIANKNSSFLFAGYYYLESIEGLENLDTSNVTNMSSMFGSWGLKELDLSVLDTSKVEDMSYLFTELYYDEHNSLVNSGSNIEKIVMNNLDLSNVKNMQGLFSGCSNLTSLELKGLDTSNVVNMSRMFEHCSFTTIDLSPLDTSNVTNMSYMFRGCTGLTSVDLSPLDTSNVIDMSGIFSGCIGVTNVDLSPLDTSNVTDMSNIFSGCTGLTNVDLSPLDTSNVTDMSYMFSGCCNLTSIDLSSFDTSNTTFMYYMFSYCESLSVIDLSSFNTSNVTGMGSMFDGCSGLTSLNLSSFDTSNVEEMQFMFSGCSSLTDLNLSSFDTSNVESMRSMFWECSSLISIDLSSFNTSKVTDMSSMFYNCSGLTEVDLSGFNTSSTIDISGMFDNCSSLVSLDLSHFDTSSVTDFGYMFDGCSSLTTLNLNSFNTANADRLEYMFRNCGNLTELNMGNIDISNISYIYDMFDGCKKINTTITIVSDSSSVSYTRIFLGAATDEGSQIIVNYSSTLADKIDKIIATKSENSNVIKGTMVTT